VFLNIVAYAMAQQPGGGGGTPGGGDIAQGLAQFFPLIFIVIIFYFLLIRPQQKRAKETKQMLDNLKKGDKIITSGGIYGLIEGLNEKTITIKIAENVKIKALRSSVTAVRSGSDDN